MNLSEIATFVGVELLRDAPFATLGFLSEPQPGMLTFLESPRYLASAARAGVAGIITTPELADRVGFAAGVALCEQPRVAFFDLHNHLATRTSFYWKGFPTEIHPSARIHPTAWVAEQSVRIGPGTVVEARAVICERTVIGAGCLVKPGAVLGSVGFQTGRVAGHVIDMAHGGGVELADDVQVLANAVIAAAVFGQSTRIGKGSRVGNLAFVSHNVQVGQRCLIGHNCVVNGNVIIGDDAWIGPGASLAHCIIIGAGARVSLGSAVIGNVEPGQQVTGNVAIPHRRYLRLLAR